MTVSSQVKKKQIGLIGCRIMGGGMARHFLAAGLDPICFEPNPDILDQIRHQMRQAGAQTASPVHALAQVAQIIILSLPKVSVIEAVMADIGSHSSVVGCFQRCEG